MKKILLILLLFLIPLCFADEAEDILYSKELTTHLTIDGSFEIIKTESKYQIDYVTVKLSYLPLESYRQEVKSHITTPKGVEAGDNILFNWDNPPIGSEKFISEYIVSTKPTFFPVKTKVYFPINNLDKNLILYTKQTNLIDINEDIKNLANQISQGEDDLYKIVFDSAIWVNENIDYELSSVTAEASLKSSWVLENRMGVCDEMTNLFISILRSLGIPARFVSGISYTNSEQFSEPWGPHGWAEVYFPGSGWVPFDPTYGQYGFVDSSHIKLKESVDSDKSSVDYEWLSYGVKIEGEIPSNDIEILRNEGRKISDVEIKLDVLESQINFESLNIFYADIKNHADEYRTVRLELIGTKNTIIKNSVKYILLKPKETKKVLWKIEFPSDLDKRKIYTFPFTLYDNFGNTQDQQIMISNGYSTLSEKSVDSYINSFSESSSILDVKLDCESLNQLKSNEELIVNCIVDKPGLTACLDNICKKVGIEFSFTKSFSDPGAYPILITVKEGELKKSFFKQVIVLDKPKLNMTFSEYNTDLAYDESEQISFVLEKVSLATPLNIEIVLEYNNQITNSKLKDFEDSQLIQFTIRGRDLSVGSNEILITLNYFDDEGNLYIEKNGKNINMKTSNILEYVSSKLNSWILFIISVLGL